MHHRGSGGDDPLLMAVAMISSSVKATTPPSNPYGQLNIFGDIISASDDPVLKAGLDAGP